MPMQISGVTIQGGMNIQPAGGSPSPGPSSDPNFSDVVFMFDGDGTNATNNNTFTDGSSNGYTVTENGTVIQGSFSPYSLPSGRAYTGSDGGSIYNQTDYNNYLSVSAGNFSTTATNYTIEAWAYWETTGTGVIINGITSGNTDRLYLSQVSGTYYFGDGDTNIIAENVGSPTTNTWTHYAVVKNGSTTKLYINGVEEASTTSSLGTYTIATWQIGARPNISVTFPGYLSDVRVVNGTAVYTGAFTPNTTPLTAITNTSLLIQGQNSAIFDLSGINSIDTVGNTQIDTSVKKFGTGSVKFDGTGDELLAPSNSNLALGSGDFTVECWIYPISNSFYNGIYQNNTDGNGAAGALRITTNNDDQTSLVLATAAAGLIYTSTGVVTANDWNHIALVRNGSGSNNLVLYVNGVSEGSVTTHH